MDKTIEYYNENADVFYETTVLADMSRQYESFLKYLDRDAKILDCGCGSGRDSKIFLEKGYKVTSIDGSRKLCNKASSLIGQEVICMKFEDISFQDEFDGIWACASLLHVREDKLPVILKKLFKSLKSDGVLYCSFKYGESSSERRGRYFADMTEEKLRTLVEEIDGFGIVAMYRTGDVRSGRENEMWLNAVFKKNFVEVLV